MSYYTEQLISRSLAYNAKYGFTNRLPPVGLDITTVTDPMVPFLDTELFTEGEGSDWSQESDAPDYDVLQGRLSCHRKSLLFSTKSGIVAPLPDHTCRYEPEILAGYADLHNVLLFMAKDAIDTDLLVVTPQTYDLSKPFSAMYDRRFFLTEYLELSEAKRQALYLFLRRPGVAQYCFLCMAYLSSLMIRNGNTLSPMDNPKAVEAVESLLRNFVGVRFEHTDLLTLINLIDLSGFFHQPPSWHLAMSLWAITHRASAWGNLPPEEALMASGLGNAPQLHSYIKLVCSPAELCSLASSIADPMLHDTDPVQAENILLHLLYTGIAMEHDTISSINRYLFYRRPLRFEDIRKFTPIRYSDNPNWSILVDDLFEKVSIELEKGSTAYARGLGLVWVCEINNLQNALSDAQLMILKEESDATTLVGTHMLSLLLEYDLSNTSKMRKPIQVELAQPILQRLTEWLIKYDEIHYTAAAILARDLVYWGADPTFLIADPRVRETALMRKAMGIGNRLYPCIVLNLIEKFS